MNREDTFDENSTYRIHVKGRLDLKWMDWFGGFEIAYNNGDTFLQGTVPDQAALHGILSKINDLGLLLLSVDRLSGVNNLPDV